MSSMAGQCHQWALAHQWQKGCLEWENRKYRYDFTGFLEVSSMGRRAGNEKNWLFSFLLCKFDCHPESTNPAKDLNKKGYNHETDR